MIKKGCNILLFLLLFYQVSYAQEEQKEYYTVVSDSALKTDKAFYYMSSLDSLLRVINYEADSLSRVKRAEAKPVQSGSSFFASLFNSKFVQFVFWAILAIFAGFVFYKLFKLDIFSPSSKDNGSTEIMETHELRLPAYYDQEILQAEAATDFALAVRYRFLKTLAVLNEQGQINFLPEKTNSAYASEIRDDEMKHNFTRVYGIYEYVWYGENKLSTEQYESIKPLFNEIYNPA